MVPRLPAERGTIKPGGIVERMKEFTKRGIKHGIKHVSSMYQAWYRMVSHGIAWYQANYMIIKMRKHLVVGNSKNPKFCLRTISAFAD
jgi:hypothetical protein